MKKLLAFVAVLSISGALVYATTVNPISNTLGDTDATANTLVYRDSDGVFDASSLKSATVVTAKLATNAVTTAKLYMDLPTHSIVCVTTKKQLGYCSNVGATGGCNCH